MNSFLKKQTIISILFIIGACIFGVLIGFFQSWEKAIEFFSGYLMEKSLSIDNLFVFLSIFKMYQLDTPMQARILRYGILGAIVLRVLFILGGIFLIHKFQWIFYIFGIFLIYSGWKLLFPHEENQPSPFFNHLKKLIPLDETYPGFWVIKDKKLFFTKAFLALLTIEFSDILFAMDSIPAVLAITTDPFIVITSNLWAILGLRSLYFLCQALVEKFEYLHYGVSIILVFIGIKLMVHGFIEIPISFSLCFMLLSVLIPIILGFTKAKKS